MTDPRPDLASLARMRPGRSGLYWLWIATLLAGLAGAIWTATQSTSQTVSYDTTDATRGTLIVTVTATGTVQPTTRIDISSELSGTLSAVAVDFNDEVAVGQVLAQLDDTKLRAQVSNAEASLAAAHARLSQAEASATEANATWVSTKELDKRGLSTQPAVAAAKAAHDRAEAAIEIARADLQLAEANLELQRADLDKAVIRSPIAGIVLNRTAEPGQIVAATLNAPILFTLAEDLAHMELQVDIDEADIGRVAVGNSASFTVDAYPGQKFAAKITSLRFAPEETDGVVTYKAVLSVENDRRLLRPGMTATATITVAELADVLLVPMSALRYAPPATETNNRSGQGLLGYIFPRRPGGERQKVDGSSLWVLRDGAPVRVSVTPGATDGSLIVVTSDDLREGDKVITDQRSEG